MTLRLKFENERTSTCLHWHSELRAYEISEDTPVHNYLLSLFLHYDVIFNCARETHTLMQTHILKVHLQ